MTGGPIRSTRTCPDTEGRGRSPRLALFSLLLLFFHLLPGSGRAQERCPAAANPASQEGWTAFRANRLDEARERFSQAASVCPEHVGARTGLAYVDLREGRDEAARQGFSWVLERDGMNLDALIGLGILAWRRGDLAEVDRRFRRVEELDPGNATAADYLHRIPPGIGAPPERPPLVVSDTVQYWSRAHGDFLEVRGSEGWEPFYVKGVNLGAALPGRNPSEFPDSATYAGWIREMGEMGVNTIRLYTIHPPWFYSALKEYNTLHPEKPLWLLHGVWAELPPGDDYLDPEWEGEFFQEMRRVVDLVHGRADLPPRPGHASGFYTADVSSWVLGWILGREWEPFSVVGFQELYPELHGWDGAFVKVRGGTAMDAWMAKAMEETARYEMARYHEQRPLSYTNWPTLDPLHHPTETTEAFPAGVFATFHAYPYYPDFMVHSPKYQGAASSWGPSDYFGYLRELKRHHAGMPVVIAEYGVPASIGIAHLQPQGWHHGGHPEEAMADIDRRLTLEIAEAGMAGGAVFAWIDEWFKKNWIVLEFELPPERNRFWLNRLDAEQHYGMVAMEALPPVDGESAQDRVEGWEGVSPLYEGREGTRLRAAYDAAYLWLNIELPESQPPGSEVMVGFDLVDPERGEFRWPGGSGPELPVGIEFALVVDGQEVRLLADPSQNPFRHEEVGAGPPSAGTRPWTGTEDVPGFFTRRAEQRFNRPYVTVENRDGIYDSLRVITNRRRFARDSTETLALGYDRGLLPHGEPPDGLWSWSEDGRVLEVRLPWMLLNFTDPSSRSLLQGQPGAREGAEDSGSLPTRILEEIRMILAVRDPQGGWSALPETGRAGDVASFTWPGWDTPRWESRKRPVFESMRDAFRQLDSWDPVAESEREGGDPTRRPGAEDPADPRPVRVIPEEGPETQEELSVLAARADRAWNEGDTEAARRLYGQILGADSTRTRAYHRLALVRAWDEDYDGSLALFDQLLSLEPANAEARVDRARVQAWSGEVRGAIQALDRILEDRPDLPQALEAKAQFQSWAGDYSHALSSYSELLGIADDPTGVLLAQARVLGWASRLEESRIVYDSILADNPQNLEARMGLARILAYSDRTDEAVSQYRSVLLDHPGNQEARRGLARALTWGGRLPEGEDAWKEALESAPDNLVSVVGLAQNLRWQGRNAAALQVLEGAEEVHGGNPDFVEQLRWVKAALSPRFDFSVVDEADSDDNRMTTTRVQGRWNPAPRFSLQGETYWKELEQTGIDLQRQAWGVRLIGTYQVEPGWVLIGGVGGSRTDASPAGSSTSFELGVTTPGRYSLGGGLSFRRHALDVTARLAEQGVEMGVLDATGRWTPLPGWQVGASGGIGTFHGAQDNRRTHLGASLTRRLDSQWTLGLSHRYFGFDEDLDEFYFDPDYFGLTELVGRWSWRPGSWGVQVEAAPGAQKIRSDGEVAGAFRASARVTYRLAPGREISLSGGYSSAGVQSFSTEDSDYRYRALILGGSWVFF